MSLDPRSWKLDYASGLPVYRQIMQWVQVAVVTGQLKEGDQLPTIRVLHEQLGVNPNTVIRAYRELESAGVLLVEQGSGTYVAPRSAPPFLEEGQRQEKLEALALRAELELRSLGLSLKDLIQYLNQRQPL